MSFIGFANSLTATRVRFRAEKLTSRHSILHRRRYNGSHFLRCLDEVIVGEVRVTRRSSMPPVSEQSAIQWQVFARHDRVAGYRVP